MVSLRAAVGCSAVVVLVLHTALGQGCGRPFTEGRGGFVLNVEGSVAEGATLISNSTTGTRDDCLRACCLDPQCNLALMETGPEVHTLTNCFLFDCLYRNRFVCSFAKKPGFTNSILGSVYQRHLSGPEGEEDKSPRANAGADKVIRAGESVTLDGIESWDDKNITKYEWKLLSGDPSVEIEKTEFADQRRLSNLHPGGYRFELRVTDSTGQTDTTFVTVLVLTQEEVELYCLSPVKVGPCRGSFPRWFFNSVAGECSQFTFGGCKANSNNYVSQQECLDACAGTTVVHGSRKMTSEVCDSQCKEGQYMCSSGCCVNGGVECDGHQHCSDGSDEQNCQSMIKTLDQLLEINISETKARCVEPPVTGPCRANMPLWFYDPLKQSCFRFTYGGCRGNDNKFPNEDDCMNICSGVTESDVFAKGPFKRIDVLDKHTGEKSRTGPAATALIIVVLIAAVFSLIGCYCMKNRKRKAESQSVTATPNPPVPLTEESHTLI